MGRRTKTVRGHLPVRRVGIASVVIALILIIAVAAIAGAAYLILSAPGQGSSTSNTTGTSSASTTTSRTSSGVSVASSLSSGSMSSSSIAGENYKGNFTYTNPLGPSGINDSSGKVVQWNSTQSASGSFTFSLNPATYIGTGSGTGSITVTTQGYCTGTTTVSYSFSITVAAPPGENMLISFETPSPANVTVQLSCQGPTTGFNEANNPVSFLSVYPNGLSVASIPTTSSQPPTYGISYTVTIAASS